MTSILVWWRRSSAPLLAPFFIAVFAVGAFTRDGWQYEWLWGMRAVVIIAVLVSPVVGGMVAFDTALSWDSVLTQLGPTLPRRLAATLLPATVYVMTAFMSVCVVWVVVAVRLSINHALWQADPLLPVEVFSAFAAAAGVGLALGARMRSLAAAPLTAVLIFGLQALAAPYGLITLFAPMGLVGSAVGLERDPAAAGFAIAMNAGLALWCFTIALVPSTRMRREGRIVTAKLALTAIPFLIALVWQQHVKPLDFKIASTQSICVTDREVRVCGPDGTKSVLNDLAAAMVDARARLAASGLDLPQDFVWGVPGVPPSTAAGPTYAFVSPAQLKNGQREAASADVLSLPRVCPQLMEPGPDTPRLADAKERLRVWIFQALSSGDAATLPQIRADYQALSNCHVVD